MVVSGSIVVVRQMCIHIYECQAAAAAARFWISHAQMYFRMARHVARPNTHEMGTKCAVRFDAAAAATTTATTDKWKSRKIRLIAVQIRLLLWRAAQSDNDATTLDSRRRRCRRCCGGCRR